MLKFEKNKAKQFLNRGKIIDRLSNHRLVLAAQVMSICSRCGRKIQLKKYNVKGSYNGG